jgi:hypothetical protein
VQINFELRAAQAEILGELKRFNVLVCHRRFGKTVLCIARLAQDALANKQNAPRYAYIAPLFRQAKQVAWDYLKLFAANIPGASINEAELRCDLPNGGRIQLFGADNYDALRGIYLDGVVMDEYAQMPPKAWSEVIRPALSDRKGWAIFIGTPKGKNQFWKLYYENRDAPDWYCGMFRASETGILDPEELESARRSMSEDEFEQEYECSFAAALQGAYFGKLMTQADRDGRIGLVPYQENIPVNTAWDIGIGDDTAIWFFQQLGPEIAIIDYIQESGQGLGHYVRALQDKAYIYGTHYVPHDFKAREFGSGKSREEQARSLGLKVKVVPQLSVDDGINAARLIIPRCRFDEKKAAYGIECLRQYRREWDEKLNDFKQRPLHDWASHGADAFRTMAVGVRDQYHKPEPTWPASQTFNEMFQNHIGHRGDSRI